MASLLGRDAELGAIASFLDAGPHPAAALVLEGEAGIGKTALWRRAVEAARARSYRVLSSAPAQAETRLSFASLRDLLARAVDPVLATLASPQRRALEAALLIAEPEGALPAQHVVAVALLGTLVALARSGAVVIAIDDVQWLDRPSEAALRFAIRRLDDEPVRLLLTHRAGPEDPLPLGLDRALPLDRVQRVVVGPLSMGAVHQLLRDTLGVPFPRPTLRKLHAASGGNPFFALEVGRAILRRAGTIGPSDPLPVPAALAELVRERLGVLPAPAREAVLATSILSNPTMSAVAALAGGSEGIEVALAAHVLERDGEHLRLGHPLLGATMLAEVPARQVRAVYRRAAGVTTDLEERARFLGLASEAPSEELAEALDQAAAHAAARGATETASELADLAVGATPPSAGSTARRALGAAQYHIAAGASRRARELLDPLERELPAGPLRAEARLAIAVAWEGDTRGARDCLDRALADAVGDERLRSRIYRARSFVELSIGDLARARRDAEAALTAAERGGDEVAGALALSELVLLTAAMGGRVEASLVTRALDVDRRLDVSSYYSPTLSVAAHYLWADRLDEARELLLQVLRRAERHGDEPARGPALRYLSGLECRAGAFTTAAAYAEEAVELLEQVLPSSQSYAGALAAEALALAYLGRVDEARAASERGVATAEACGDVVFRAASLGALGFLELSLGNAAAAARALGPLPAAIEAMGCLNPSVHAVEPDAIEALIAVGALAEAEAVLTGLQRKAVAAGSPSMRAAAARLRAVLAAQAGDTPQAFTALEESRSLLEPLPRPFERARTLLALGAVQRRTKQRGEARRALERAVALFEQLGAPLWAERARGELARIGGRRASGRELTATERRVAELVASGRTNREVAAELFVTVSTVEATLTHVYGKIGVRSRTELARRLGKP